MEVINISKTKIGSIEAIFIILTIVVSHSMLSLPRNYITITKSATIINIFFITGIATLLSILIYKLIKNFNSSDIIDISEYLGGKVFKNIIGTIFIFHFIICSSMLLRNFCEGLKLVYFPMTEIVFILLLFIIGICISNILGNNTSIKSNLIILPFALLSIIFIFIANFKNFTPQKIFPILGNGFYDTFIVGLINLTSFEGIIYLYFLPPYLKEPEKYKKIAITSMLLTGLYLVLCVSILLFIFPAFHSTNEIMPLYSATRYISFGTFLQRMDSFFMLIWIMAFLSYLAIICKFCIGIFQKITNVKNSKPIITIFGFLILGISLLPKNLSITNFFENNIYHYLSLGIVFILSIGILIIANIKKRSEKKNLSKVGQQ